MCKRASEIYLKEEPCPLNKYFDVKTDLRKSKNENYHDTLTKKVKRSVQDRPEISWASG